MKLCVTTCTYNRPHLLPRVIYCFQQQDHQDRCMLIYDDGGQYDSQWIGDNCFLLSVKERQPSLGHKRNKCFNLANEIFGDIDVVLPCDDDDLFLPWHLSAAATALENSDWSRPSVIVSGKILTGDVWIFVQNYTGNPEDHTKNRLYHPAHAFRAEAFRRVGGYVEGLSGPEDQGLMRRLEAAGARQADPCKLFPPSYVYIWGNSNISGLLSRDIDHNGTLAWDKLRKDLHAGTTIEQWTPPFDIHNLSIINKEPFARPF